MPWCHSSLPLHILLWNELTFAYLGVTWAYFCISWCDMRLLLHILVWHELTLLLHVLVWQELRAYLCMSLRDMSLLYHCLVWHLLTFACLGVTLTYFCMSWCDISLPLHVLVSASRWFPSRCSCWYACWHHTPPSPHIQYRRMHNLNHMHQHAYYMLNFCHLSTISNCDHLPKHDHVIHLTKLN